jgi:NADPH:quinone reductase-like Zn-dependent oxidoreductase
VRGAQIVELGEPPQPAEVPEQRGDLAVTIEAVALNPLDLNVARGAFYGGHPPLPYVPGCEAVGRTADGRRVYLFGDWRGTRHDGFLAERTAVASTLPVDVPDGIDPAAAAAAGIAGVAGWVPVAWKAKVTADDRVLVLGATGAVGRIAVQAARLLGATHVVGAARQAGEGVIALGDVPDAFPDGFTVCIDPIWGEPLAGALAVAAPHARIVHIGQAAGAEAPLRSADVRGKELQILGHSNFVLTPEERARAYHELLAHAAAGRITIAVETFPLDRVADAWRRQGEGAKAVVVF